MLWGKRLTLGQVEGEQGGRGGGGKQRKRPKNGTGWSGKIPGRPKINVERTGPITPTLGEKTMPLEKKDQNQIPGERRSKGHKNSRRELKRKNYKFKEGKQ